MGVSEGGPEWPGEARKVVLRATRILQKEAEEERGQGDNLNGICGTQSSNMGWGTWVIKDVLSGFTVLQGGTEPSWFRGSGMTERGVCVCVHLPNL